MSLKRQIVTKKTSVGNIRQITGDPQPMNAPSVAGDLKSMLARETSTTIITSFFRLTTDTGGEVLCPDFWARSAATVLNRLSRAFMTSFSQNRDFGVVRWGACGQLLTV